MKRNRIGGAAAAALLTSGLAITAGGTPTQTEPVVSAVEDPRPPRPAPIVAPPAHVKTPAPTARASRAARARTEGLPAILLRIRHCESRGDYRAENSRSSASGAYQFLDGTWRSTTGLKPPASAYSRAVQDAAALKLYRAAGGRPWNASKGCWS